MANLTSSQRAALEKKALAADSKSEGMRMLFEKGYTVAQVRVIFDVRYSFAYGVYSRTGASGATTPRAAKPKAAKATASKARASSKAPARPAARSKSTASRSKAKAKA